MSFHHSSNAEFSATLHTIKEASGKVLSFKDIVIQKLNFILIPAKDPIIRQEFNAHISQSQSAFKQLALSMILLTFTSISISKVFPRLMSNSETYPGARVVYVILIVLMIVMNISGLLLFVALFNKSENNFLSNIYKRRSTIQAVYLFCLSAFESLYFIARIFEGDCGDAITNNHGFCNVYEQTKGVPPNSLTSLICFTFIAVSILRETRFPLILSIWLMAVIAYLFSALRIDPANLILGCLVFIVISALIIIDIMNLNFEMFLTARKLQTALDDNESMAAADRANELRHMIANVAHDLKTVRILTIYFNFDSRSDLFIYLFIFICFFSHYPVLWLAQML